jgi:type IV pilus assembly protein PilY1
MAGAASAAPADISPVPPATLTSSNVRANLMFILDDSGSMANEYIPDDVSSDSGKRCYAYSGHNYIYFDPAFTYTPPVDSSNTPMANANFSGVYTDGFTPTGTTMDLSDHGNLISASTALSSSTSTSTVGPAVCGKKTDSACSTGTTTTNTPVVTNGLTTTTTVVVSKTRGNASPLTCGNTANSCTLTTTTTTTVGLTGKPYWVTLNASAANDCTDANYTPVYDASTLTATQKQNYANWFQYYRRRMMMMRTASGKVFAAIDATRFRVAFSTISNTGVADNSDFLNIADYDYAPGGGLPTQKSNFFTHLYGQAPSGSTPLRPALEKAGKYFAKKASSQTVDPMQYSCQRNYTLLSTDGYWNTAAEPTSYKPQKLDGSGELGNQDGVLATAPRPQYDSTGSKNSLADIAKYYYDTDLRTLALNNCTGSVPGQDVCVNKNPKPGDTSPLQQNMTTYTLGLGVPGVFTYQSNYDSATSGDYFDIVAGTKNWPDPLSSTATGGLANTGNTVTSRIDDLWHAAVNGGGRYYSARNPDQLVAGLTDALSKITAETGASSSAATSTLRPVTGDDWVFLPSFETKTWVGDIGAYHFTFDAVTGAVSITSTAVWRAANTLATQTTRSVKFFDSASTNKLKDFTYDNLPASLQTNFNNLCLAGAYKLSQCAGLTTTARSRVTGTNVVAYLAGNKQYEMFQPAADDQIFRSRQNKSGAWTPLGDVINASPAYVHAPPFKYVDAGYAAFRAAKATRDAVVYVGANDGMLHAFKVTDGSEMWAFVPTQVMPNLYNLADKAYEGAHRYFVDGNPVVADVYDGTNWRTILVGGFNAGGRGYYALDITDPTTPKGLWEYTEADLGYTYGDPVIAKNKAGTWIVAFTSGYNNTAGDGNGHLYVLNAVTGAFVSKTDTMVAVGVKAGSVATPSNLGKINAWVDDATDNTAKRFYGGDMLGYVWRFDFDDNIAPAGKEAFLLGRAQDALNNPQPITVSPLLSELGSGSTKFALVSVGTGRYLGQSDLGDTKIQSLYSFKDKLDTTSLGVFRNNAAMVQETMDTNHVQSSSTNIDWTTSVGWYIDFDKSSGERVNVEMDLQLGLITVATSVPTPTPCSPGGTSWLYFFGVESGRILGSSLSPTLIVGVGDILEGTNKSQATMSSLAAHADGSFSRTPAPTSTGSGGGTVQPRRTTWRELVN